jgi:hypothetical protein
MRVKPWVGGVLIHSCYLRAGAHSLPSLYLIRVLKVDEICFHLALLLLTLLPAGF